MAGAGGRPVRESPTGPVELGYDGRPLARYVWRPDLPGALSPRPYLHPVQTLAGVLVTDLMPHSHPYHLGVSVAVPDLDGVNFWGGRTFVPGHGPAWLDNHGVQRHDEWLTRRPNELAHTLTWLAPDGSPLLHERRTITCRPVTDTAWALGFELELSNVAGRPLPLRSPATLGRTGAGYGGFFWRAATTRQPVQVFGPAGGDVSTLHGARSEWLAVVGADADRREWTLLFVAADHATAGDPWFLRTRDYLGVGSSLAWTEPRILSTQDRLHRRISTVVADGVLSPAGAADLAGTVRARL